MIKITKKEIINKLLLSNPWWGENPSIDNYLIKMKRRAYIDIFYDLTKKTSVNRAVVLMGPRRVGKTVMIFHTIQRLIEKGVDPKRICYVSIDSPVYIGLKLDTIFQYFLEFNDISWKKGFYVFFDEIQYLKNWEVHLKTLVDDYRDGVFIASGSAAAALKAKSIESGAGRFTDFYLPPLTFYEYLSFIERDTLIISNDKDPHSFFRYSTNNIESLNQEFVNYLNFGGYPEVIYSDIIKADPHRYIRSDIIDKVLLRDLPSLYGINDVQELNKLFTMLAYNTGNEVSLNEISKSSGIAKNTIKKYLEYLEAAFLIKILQRVDQYGKRFKRANYFKVYLTNPSMRCALFEPIYLDSPLLGNMTETAIVSQWIHARDFQRLFYSRWQGGEVDLVFMGDGQIAWGIEVKWSNRYFDKPNELKSLLNFARKNKLNESAGVTTIDKRGIKVTQNLILEFIESSIYCYGVGRNTTESKKQEHFNQKF